MKPDDARTLYEVYHRAWPSRSATPTHDNLAAMRRILHECGGLERAGVYLAWVAQAEDVWARQIRGKEPWPDGKVKARLDAVSLSRNIPGRLDEALAWDARGRTTPADAPKASEPDRVAALVSMLEELVEHGGDPDQCANPGRARKVLGVWYGHGGGPASVASLAMRDRTFALRDIATAMVRARMAQQAAPRAEVPRG